MNRIRCLFFLWFFLPIIAFCQAKDSAYPKTFLWEITGNGLPAASYLYGTTHIICEEDIVMPELLKQKIITAKEFYVEAIPLKKLDSMPKQMLINGDSTLKDLIGEYYYAKVEKIFNESVKRGYHLLNKLKPFHISRMLDMVSLPCKAIAYETVFMDLAKKEQVPINGLESLEEHADVVDNLGLKMQVFQLKLQLENPDIRVKGMQQMMDLYKQKELLKLYYKTINGNKTDPHFKAGLLDDRNVLWIPRMIRAMKKQNVFFAVGCAHLPGENGVINLLRDEGYTVTPIFY